MRRLSPVDYQFQNKSKFALLTVNNVYTELPPAKFQLSDGTWVMPGVPVLDLGVWKEWIGSIRMERLGDANLVLFVEEPSDNPEIAGDAQHQRMDKDLHILFCMMHLRTGIECADGADLLCGSSQNSVPGIRQMSQMPTFYQSKGWQRAPAERGRRRRYCASASPEGANQPDRPGRDSRPVDQRDFGASERID